MNEDLLALLRARLCSPQWEGFVRALGETFAEVLSVDELHRLFHRVGARFALDRPLPDTTTLEEVAEALNASWSRIDWGLCRVRDDAGRVSIEHCLAPIGVALPGADWTDGFLEGAYHQWFRQAGMPDGLAVRAEPGGTADVRRFRLSRTSTTEGATDVQP